MKSPQSEIMVWYLDSYDWFMKMITEELVALESDMDKPDGVRQFCRDVLDEKR